MRGPMKAWRSIDEYIASFPAPVQAKLSELRSTISEAAPGAIEKFSYGIPTFHEGKNLVHFAAYERHIGFYPTSSGITEFQDDLKKYKTSRGAVQFPIDEPLPLRLIARIVRYRVTQNSRRQKAATGRKTAAKRAAATTRA